MYEIAENVDIKDLIYEVRGKQIMLDYDLAKLYRYKNGTKEINQAVKNNPDKFPKRYCFKLNDKDYDYLRSKILTTNSNINMSRINSTAFTEQGIYMLAIILKTKVATEATIKIMDTFVNMRKFINENKDIFKRMIEIENDTSYIKNTLLEHDKNFEIIFDKFDREYPLLNVKYTNRFHDRFIILDNKELYHIGASLKDLGNKIFAISKIEDKRILEDLKERNNNLCMK